MRSATVIDAVRERDVTVDVGRREQIERMMCILRDAQHDSDVGRSHFQRLSIDRPAAAQPTGLTVGVHPPARRVRLKLNSGSPGHRRRRRKSMWRASEGDAASRRRKDGGKRHVSSKPMTARTGRTDNGQTNR